MQHEITQNGPLLNANGTLREPGWARSLLLDYRRADVKAGKLRIKEWDYYIITNDSFGVALTIADNSYMGLISASVLEFENRGNKPPRCLPRSRWGNTGCPKQAARAIRFMEISACRWRFGCSPANAAFPAGLRASLEKTRWNLNLHLRSRRWIPW